MLATLTPVHTRIARFVLETGPVLAPEQAVVLERDPARARAIARRHLAIYLRAPDYTNNLRRPGFTAAEFADEGSERLVDALVVWGDLGSIRRRIEEHLTAGADHVCLQVLTDDPERPPARRMADPGGAHRVVTAV